MSTGRLSFGSLLSTRMACPPDSLDSPFMKDLQRVVSFFLENGKLYLEPMRAAPAVAKTMKLVLKADRLELISSTSAP